MSKKSMAERRQAAAAGGPRNGRPAGRSARGGAQYRRSNRGGSTRPWALIGAIGGVVAVFLAVIIFFDVTAGNGGQDTQVLAAPASVVAAITHVPTRTLTQVGTGDINNPPQPIKVSTPKLTQNGKPEVLYIGAEYCPYCALLRWSLVGALSRFGKFSNLQIIRGSATDPAGQNIATFTFAHGVTYSSPYVSFVTREMYSNVPTTSNSVGYLPFEALTKQESQIFNTVCSGPSGPGFPCVDYGGLSAQVGTESAPPSQPGPPGLQGYDWQQIANFLSKPSSVPAKMILGGINYDTAALCQLTGNKPGSVCNTSLIQQLEKTT
ncbi:MAG: DUF929 family protein [Candidatus Dormibacteria bacterium]